MHNYVILFCNVSDQIEWFYFSFVFKLIRWLYMYMYIKYYSGFFIVESNEDIFFTFVLK